MAIYRESGNLEVPYYGQPESMWGVVYVQERLAELARDGGDVRELLAPLVDMLLALRNDARNARRFEEADRLRTVLLRSGVELQDSAAGTAWSLAHA